MGLIVKLPSTAELKDEELGSYLRPRKEARSNWEQITI
jgi:hypothetical protein